jgi:hypothetical protein
MWVVDNSGSYYDVGLYYEFQDTGFGWLATSGNSITITGTNLAVNLWLNPESIGWYPTGTAGVEELHSVGSLAYGFSNTAGTITIGPSSTFYKTLGSAGTCTAGNTYTISQLSTCFGSSTQFAFRMGIAPNSVGTFTATITGVTSQPHTYP